MTDNKLLPCPFCGWHTPDLKDVGMDRYQYLCPACGASSGASRGDFGIQRQWNMRPSTGVNRVGDPDGLPHVSNAYYTKEFLIQWAAEQRQKYIGRTFDMCDHPESLKYKDANNKQHLFASLIHYLNTRPTPSAEVDRVGEQEDYPECSGNPNSCPENEGYGCCNNSLEIVARAIYEAGYNPDISKRWSEKSYSAKYRYKTLAKAAIAAMGDVRSPSYKDSRFGHGEELRGSSPTSPTLPVLTEEQREKAVEP